MTSFTTGDDVVSNRARQHPQAVPKLPFPPMPAVDISEVRAKEESLRVLSCTQQMGFSVIYKPQRKRQAEAQEKMNEIWEEIVQSSCVAVAYTGGRKRNTLGKK